MYDGLKKKMAHIYFTSSFTKIRLLFFFLLSYVGKTSQQRRQCSQNILKVISKFIDTPGEPLSCAVYSIRA